MASACVSTSHTNTGALPGARGMPFSALTSGATAAVKCSVCRAAAAGSAPRHSSSSGSMLPGPWAASSRSASSSTRNRTRFSPRMVSSPDVRMWSASRPGVAMMMCGRLASSMAWGRMSAPPVTSMALTVCEVENDLTCSKICRASSLHGMVRCLSALAAREATNGWREGGLGYRIAPGRGQDHGEDGASVLDQPLEDGYCKRYRLAGAGPAPADAVPPLENLGDAPFLDPRGPLDGHVGQRLHQPRVHAQRLKRRVWVCGSEYRLRRLQGTLALCRRLLRPAWFRQSAAESRRDSHGRRLFFVITRLWRDFPSLPRLCTVETGRLFRLRARYASPATFSFRRGGRPSCFLTILCGNWPFSRMDTL